MELNWESGWNDEGGQVRAWVGVTAGVVVLSLMAAFVWVVIAGVRQGDQRRQERIAQDDASWRCKSLNDKAARADCLLQPAPLTAQPGLSATR